MRVITNKNFLNDPHHVDTRSGEKKCYSLQIFDAFVIYTIRLFVLNGLRDFFFQRFANNE